MTDTQNNSATSFNNRNKNLKPFLSVFIILIIIMSVYYFFWRSSTIKMKDIIASSLNNFKYDSITISGFPLSKTIKINNITFDNNTFLISKNQVKIKEIKISSLVFSDALNIKFKDITTLDTNNNTVYSLMFNEEPEINVSFYSNGSLKSFNYTDLGYRVIAIDNRTLYTAGESKITVASTKNLNTIDYAINGELKNMQNILVIEKRDQIIDNVVPQIYNITFDISSSITKKEGIIIDSIIKINNFNFFGNNENGISMTGEIFKDSIDPYSFGNLKFVLSNYQNILNSYKNDFLEAFELELQNEAITPEEKNNYVQMTNDAYNVIINLIKKNQQTKDNQGVIEFERKKNDSNYIINGENIIDVIQNIVK